MENKSEQKNDQDIKNRISIIIEIMKRFKIINKIVDYSEDDISKFEKDKENEIEEIKSCFEDLNTNEIAYILYLFSLTDDKKSEIIINFFDTINTILSHYKYYKKKNPKIKYNNSHFDNYLLKRYECSYMFTTYLSDLDCRELKIDNKLYFNYIPIKCLENHQSGDTEKKETCGFSHNKIELQFHPFVYKKFKCVLPDCKKDCYCYYYHTNNDGETLDMETEVDFDSNEINHLKEVLASLNLDKKDNDNKEKKSIFLNNKSKEKSDFIPTEFNPETYKRYKCPLNSICKLNNKLCLNYHNEKDRRRNPDIYEAKLCPNLFKNNKRIKDAHCDKGDECNCAHNLFEYFYHPDKFRKLKCKQENKEEGKYCKERLICPYYHESDYDCGENGKKMILDPQLIFDYYRSLMVTYEKSIDSESKKLEEIKKRYVCYKCGIDNALSHKSFLVDVKEKKIVCESCSKENNIKCQEIQW